MPKIIFEGKIESITTTNKRTDSIDKDTTKITANDNDKARKFTLETPEGELDGFNPKDEIKVVVSNPQTKLGIETVTIARGKKKK